MMKEGWEYKTLGMICKIYNGNSINADYKKTHYMGLTKGYPFIATKDVSFDGTINYENGVKIPFDEGLKVAKPSSVFICVEGGSAGRKIGLVDRDVCFGNKLFCLESKGSVLGPFIYYYLKSGLFQQQFAERLTGLIGGVSAKKFNDISIIYPSLSEQQSIVEYLDSSFAKIDKLKENAAKNLEEAKALFQSALKDALEPKEGWEEKTLEDICDFIRGPFGGSLKKDCFKERGYAVYEQQNAIYNRFTFRYYIDEVKYQSMIRFKVNPGDLIMSCSGTIGKVAIIPQNAEAGIINQALLKLTPHKEIKAHYLKYLMESKYFEEIINANIEGVAIKNIASVATLKKIAIVIPSISEQQSIVSFLDSLNEKINTLQQNYSRICDECDALKQAILRQVFE